MDNSKIEAFQERLFTELNSGMSMLTLQLGHKLGYFDTLATEGPSNAKEFASKTGTNERYALEWLEAMAAGGYLEHTNGVFSLPPEYAEVLTQPNNEWSAIGVLGWITSFANVMPQLTEAFRSGGGVPYEAYGLDMVTAQAMGTRPMFLNDYASKWIPAMPDVQKKLEAGGKVAEVGAGLGWSSIALAKGFPSTTIDSIDPDDLSIKEAEAAANEEGVEDQIRFHLSTVEEAEVEGPYDLVTAIECIHDMPYPVQALTRMRELAGADGAVLVVDEAVGDTLEENSNFMGHLFYNYSVLHCLPQAMGFPNSAATGTVIKPSILRKYAEEAGFSDVEILPIENGQFRFYRLRQ
jgi:2-polyprenyl-3-methyl-5-hydroxy-6-metoxy-1,4-benzoquinol methylase